MVLLNVELEQETEGIILNMSNTKYPKVSYLITPTAIAFALIKQHGVEHATEVIGHMIGDNDEAVSRVGRAIRVYRHKLTEKKVG